MDDVLDGETHVTVATVVTKHEGFEPSLGLSLRDALHGAELLALPTMDRPECFTARVLEHGVLASGQRVGQVRVDEASDS